MVQGKAIEPANEKEVYPCNRYEPGAPYFFFLRKRDCFSFLSTMWRHLLRQKKEKNL